MYRHPPSSHLSHCVSRYEIDKDIGKKMTDAARTYTEPNNQNHESRTVLRFMSLRQVSITVVTTNNQTTAAAQVRIYQRGREKRNNLV